MEFVETPIENAKNIGPIVGSELSSIGIRTLEQLIQLGWEEACIRFGETYPYRINLNAFAAIIGAIENVDWRDVESYQKLEAKKLIMQLKREGRFS